MHCFSKQKFFVEDWLSDPDLKDWVRKYKNNKANARCSVCNKTLALSTAGRSALTDHANGRKHSEAVKKIQNFFTSAKKSTDSIASSSSAQEGKQQTLDLHVHNANFVKSEIICILKSICSGYSNRSCEQLNFTLKAMFPDSKIAEPFSMGRAKSTYMINHELALFLKSLLLSELNKSDILIFSFDESLNQVTQTCEMAVYVLFWDVTELKVNVRFIGSIFLAMEKIKIY